MANRFGKKFASPRFFHCASTYGVRRENQTVEFISEKVKLKTVWRVKDANGQRYGEVAGSNVRVIFEGGSHWKAF